MHRFEATKADTKMKYVRKITFNCGFVYSTFRAHK